MTPEELKAAKYLITNHAINSMLAKNFFSVVPITEAIDTVGDAYAQDMDEYKMLRSLHCLDWRAMPPELKALVPVLINSIFCGRVDARFPETPPVTPKALEPEAELKPWPEDLPTPQKSQWFKFFGRKDK